MVSILVSSGGALARSVTCLLFLASLLHGVASVSRVGCSMTQKVFIATFTSNVFSQIPASSFEQHTHEFEPKSMSGPRFLRRTKASTNPGTPPPTTIPLDTATARASANPNEVVPPPGSTLGNPSPGELTCRRRHAREIRFNAAGMSMMKQFIPWYDCLPVRCGMHHGPQQASIMSMLNTGLQNATKILQACG